MNKGLPQHLQTIVETLCGTGCQRVNEIIETLTKGADVKDTAALTEKERKQVLHELQSIMSVYDQDDQTSAEGNSSTAHTPPIND